MDWFAHRYRQNNAYYDPQYHIKGLNDNFVQSMKLWNNNTSQLLSLVCSFRFFLDFILAILGTPKTQNNYKITTLHIF